MEASSIESSTQRTGPEISKSREAERKVEVRVAARSAEQVETNQRREAAKSDPSRGQNIDTFA